MDDETRKKYEQDPNEGVMSIQSTNPCIDCVKENEMAMEKGLIQPIERGFIFGKISEDSLERLPMCFRHWAKRNPEAAKAIGLESKP